MLAYSSKSIEKKKICKFFQSNFNRLKHKSFVLYGLGYKTENLINGLKDFKILGLMHKNNNFVGKKFYNKKILSISQIKKIKPIIVIISKKENSTQIFEEISFLKKYNVEIFFLNGKPAKKIRKDSSLKLKKVSENNFNQLKKKILSHEIISFDLYDTLISRVVNNPHDVFDMVESKAHDKFAKHINFTIKRIEAENECFEEKLHNFSLEDIYIKLKNKLKISNDVLNQIKQIEINLEVDFTIPEQKIIELYNFAIKNKKKVSIITDMYLSKQIILKILKKNKIKKFRNLLISCEINKNKLDGSIYPYFKKIENGKNYLHLGDSFTSDISNAKKFGFDTAHIFSTKELVRISNLDKHTSLQKNNITDLLTYNLIVNRIFNKYSLNFDKKNGKPIINNFKDVGYIFFAPLIFYYIVWLIQNALKLKINKILFCAREGYFIKKLYLYLCNILKIKRFPEAIYFKTSRRMAVVSSLKNVTDIQKTFKRHRFFGTLNFLLKNRLGILNINLGNEGNKLINTNENFDQLKRIIKKYKNLILKNSRREERNYKIYLNKIFGNSKKNFAISDQGFFGSVQNSIEKILNLKIFGLYLACAHQSKKKNFFKIGFYNYPKSYFKSLNHISETFLTAPEGTYLYHNGKKFVKDKKMKNQKNFKVKELMFLGVKEFFNDMVKLDKKIITKKLNSKFSDQVFGLISKELFSIDKKILNTFYFDNRYVREDGENKIII